MKAVIVLSVVFLPLFICAQQGNSFSNVLFLNNAGNTNLQYVPVQQASTSSTRQAQGRRAGTTQRNYSSSRNVTRQSNVPPTAVNDNNDNNNQPVQTNADNNVDAQQNLNENSNPVVIQEQVHAPVVQQNKAEIDETQQAQQNVVVVVQEQKKQEQVAKRVISGGNFSGKGLKVRSAGKEKVSVSSSNKRVLKKWLIKKNRKMKSRKSNGKRKYFLDLCCKW